MIPDLGAYAFEVLTAYAVSIVLLVAIIWLSVSRSRSVRAQLEDIEAQVHARKQAKARTDV